MPTPLFLAWSHSQQPWPRRQPVQQVCRAAKVTFMNWSVLSRPWRLICRHSATRWVWAGKISGQVPSPPQNLLSGAHLSNSPGALLHPNSHFPCKLSTMRMIRAIVYWGVHAVPHSLYSMSSILILTFPDRAGVSILEIRKPKPQTVKWIDQGHTVNKWPMVKPHGGLDGVAVLHSQNLYQCSPPYNNATPFQSQEREIPVPTWASGKPRLGWLQSTALLPCMCLIQWTVLYPGNSKFLCLSHSFDHHGFQ